jgi:hypothetical protein
VSRNSDSDTPEISPSQMFRNGIEAAGFMVERVPSDLTMDQVGELAEELVRKLDELMAWKAKAQV